MATEHLTQGYVDAFTKARKTRDKKYTHARNYAKKMETKISKQWSSGTLTSEKARKADAKMDWYRKDAYKKADQAYDKAIKVAKAKQAKVRSETAKGWGQLEPKKKIEKKKTAKTVLGSETWYSRREAAEIRLDAALRERRKKKKTEKKKTGGVTGSRSFVRRNY